MFQKKIEDVYLVVGGELRSLDGVVFKDLSKLELVGFFSEKKKALDAWKSCSQSTVDNSHQRYFVIPLHEFFKNIC